MDHTLYKYVQYYCKISPSYVHKRMSRALKKIVNYFCLYNIDIRYLVYLSFERKEKKGFVILWNNEWFDSSILFALHLVNCMYVHADRHKTWFIVKHFSTPLWTKISCVCIIWNVLIYTKFFIAMSIKICFVSNLSFSISRKISIDLQLIFLFFLFERDFSLHKKIVNFYTETQGYQKKKRVFITPTLIKWFNNNKSNKRKRVKIDHKIY